MLYSGQHTRLYHLFAASVVVASMWSAQPAMADDWLNSSPLETLNQQLPRFLRLSALERARVEGFENGGFKPDNRDLYLLQRLRVDLTIQPASLLKIVLQTQDARVFGKNQIPAPPYQATWDLREAYVEIGDIDKAPITVRAGRQEFVFGEERLIGPSNWTNTARAFDAVRATLRYRKTRLHAFASSVVVQTDGEVGKVMAGNDLHGVYSQAVDVVPGSVIEPYFFWRLQPRLQSESGSIGNLDMKVMGLRWIGKLPGRLDYNTDLVLERGSVASDSISAWAGHWALGGSVRSTAQSPHVFAEFDYASGDRNSKDLRRNTFDQLYPSGHDKYGLADQIGWKNVQLIRTGTEFHLRPKWNVAARYSDYWLADRHDALYNTSSSIVADSANGSDGRWVGQELDAVTTVRIGKPTQVGAGIAHIFPGTFLKRTTPGASYTFPYIFVERQF